jgi:glycolate oxidase FAD binding subunit
MGSAIDSLGLDVHDERVEIPGQTIGHVCAPGSIDELGELVLAAAEDSAGLLVMGGRSRLHWANRASGIALGVSISRLAGIDEFEPDEGVLHVSAGTRISDIRRAAMAEGWELPLDSAGPDSTIGGTIASGATGPRAQAFGPVKDAILGLEVVGGDGVATKCGARVVKNVTGYDMAKLYCGSFGSLAIITGAWLRLRPVPSVRRVLRAECAADQGSFEAIRKLASLDSIRALCWQESPGSGRAEIVAELGGREEGVLHDAERLSEVVSLEKVADDRVDVIRDEVRVSDDAVGIRARVLGSRCEEMKRAALDAGLSVSLDPGLGLLHAKGTLPDFEALLGLRSRAEACGGFAVFESLPSEWRGEVDVFGARDGSEFLAETLAERFDPAGILNPGRFGRRTKREGSA